MTTLRQPNSNPLWTEEKGSGAAIAIALAHYVDDGAGGWTPEDVSVGNPTAARAFDIGEGPTLFNVASPFVLIDDGAGGLLVASAGTPAGCLVDDGAGGLVTSTDLTASRAGQLYTDGAGDVHPVRTDATELLLLDGAGGFLTYE